MSFWSDLKKTGQEAAEKAKDLAEIGKLQLTQRDQESKLEKMFIQLGKDFYEKCPQEEGTAFYELARSITQLKAEMAVTREQLTLLKGGVRCEACGTLMEADTVFCPQCGTRREIPKEEPETIEEAAPGKMICPGCGKQVDPRAFCSHCGAKL